MNFTHFLWTRNAPFGMQAEGVWIWNTTFGMQAEGVAAAFMTPSSQRSEAARRS